MSSYADIYGADGKKPFVELANRMRTVPLATSTASSQRSLAMSGAFGRNWQGGIKMSNGYRFMFLPDHPRANSQGYIPEHIAVIESAIGKFLSPGAMPHHVNENKHDNSNANLVICEDRAFHNLLHRRMRALKDCGHADWLKCQYCKCYDKPQNLTVLINSKGHVRGRHKHCYTKYEVERQRKKRLGH